MVVAALPSVFLSENVARAADDWRSYWEILIAFLVGAHIARVRMEERACAVLLVSSVAACLVAFVQRAGGLHAGALHIGAEHRVSGTLHTMTFAGVLYQLIVFFSAAALSRRAAHVRGWVAIAVAAQFGALMFTMTRGAWIAVLAGLAASCIVLRSRALALACAVAFTALALFSSLHARDQGRTIAVGEFAKGEPDRNVATRLVLWDMSWEMFLDHPLLGVGMGDYTIEARRRLEARKVRTTVDSHNVFLQVLATRGLVGFVPFAVFFVVLIRSLASIAAASPRGSLARHYAAGALGATVAILAGAITENNVDDSEVFIALMFLVGVARSARHGPREEAGA
jgi:O-antigen ligase